MQDRGCLTCPDPLPKRLMRLARPSLIPLYIEWRRTLQKVGGRARGDFLFFLKDWADDLKAALYAARGERPCLGHRAASR